MGGASSSSSLITGCLLCVESLTRWANYVSQNSYFTFQLLFEFPPSAEGEWKRPALLSFWFLCTYIGGSTGVSATRALPALPSRL